MADPTRVKPNRARVNVPSSQDGWTVLPVAGRKGRPPKCLLPLSDEGRKLWARWWSSPMATQWSETDVPGLSRLADLYETVLEGGSLNQSQTAQIDRLEKSFGLTPEGRKSLKWRVADVPAEQESKRRSSRSKADDPRKMLRVVGD